MKMILDSCELQNLIIDPSKSENVMIYDDVTIEGNRKRMDKAINAQRNQFRAKNGSRLCPVCNSRSISANVDSCFSCKTSKEQMEDGKQTRSVAEVNV